MVSLIFVANRPSWAPLYSNMEPGDAAVIVEKLQGKNKSHISLLPEAEPLW
ncbi:MAG: hypothetical protein CM1200mP28_14450 [Deltaproteobacteria bacterium]|nr:MAG: hypothetical protein CM1200mP28_14450 [Deltaproteobacteria bacterium]